MKNKLPALLIFSQLIIVFYLVISFFEKRNFALKTVKIDPINKDFLYSTPSGTLKYYYELKPNIVWEEKVIGLEKKAYHTINSDSLNERFEYRPEKNSETLRIITLGDSFTFGQFVNTANNYPEKLEEKLKLLDCKTSKKYEVINLGVVGFDFQYSVERFRRKGIKYKPDLIIWLVKDDDFDLIENFIHPEASKFEKEGYPLFDTKTGQWPALNKAIEKMDQVYTEDQRLALQKKTIKSIRQYYQNKILFIVLTENPKYVTIIDNFVKQDGKSYLLTTNKLNNANLKFIDQHPNEKGYEILTEEIYKFISEKDLVQCGNRK